MEYHLSDSQKTLALGQKLALKAKCGDVIALRGDLGAGKTTLSRGFIQALCDVSDVPSPTYTLVQTYETSDFEIWHCDFYRLDTPDDIYELGVLDAFEEAVTVMEWPDKIGHHVPDNCLNVTILFDDEARRVRITGPDEWMERLHDL